MAFLTKEQILESPDLEHKDVLIPEWKGTVRVRSATSKERDEYENSLTTVKLDENGKSEVVQDYANAKARLVVKCLLDDKDKRLFKDSEAMDLGRKNGAVISRLFGMIQEMSGMSRKSKDQLEKNSDSGRSEDSTSPLPDTSK